jgi:hypothetical protein
MKAVLVDVVMVAFPIGLIALVRAQARHNRTITRRPGYWIGGPDTRIDRKQDQ